MPQVIKLSKDGNCPGDKEPQAGGSFASKVVSYGKSYAAWNLAGRPVRTDAEVEAIFETICVPCPNFKPRKRGGRCGLCGCGLNIQSDKIRWATEQCPDKPPRWTATAGPLAQEAQVQEAPPQETRRQKRIRERAEAKAKRSEGRAARRKRKEAERAALGGVMPPPTTVEAGKDPLVFYDRHSQPIGHALRDMWQGCAAFYVCGGPSLKQIDLSFLKERGIVSLGVNNVAGYAPVRAMVFSDPASKFHHGIFFDAAMYKFVPKPKLSERVRAKLPDGTFQWTAYEVRHCPTVFGFDRDGRWEDGTFLTREAASWGVSKKHKENQGKDTILFSFFLGLRLLHYLGVRRIYMLGVDFGMDAEHGYAFDQYRHPGACDSNNNSYRVATKMLIKLRPELEQAGLQVFQTNPESNLRVFDYVPLEDAITDCRGLVPPEPFDMRGWYEKLKNGPQPDASPVTDDRGEE